MSAMISGKCMLGMFFYGVLISRALLTLHLLLEKVFMCLVAMHLFSSLRFSALPGTYVCYVALCLSTRMLSAMLDVGFALCFLFVVC